MATIAGLQVGFVQGVLGAIGQLPKAVTHGATIINAIPEFLAEEGVFIVRPVLPDKLGLSSLLKDKGLDAPGSVQQIPGRRSPAAGIADIGTSHRVISVKEILTVITSRSETSRQEGS